MDSVRHVPPSSPLSELTRSALEALLVGLFAEVAALKRIVAEQREEIARLKGLKGRPRIQPSGMDKGTDPAKADPPEKRRRGKVSPRVSVEREVIEASVPPGSRFKGYEPFLVRDLVISVRAICYQRERWITPDDPGALAWRDRRSFRPGTPPLRADAISPGTNDTTPVAGVFAIGGRVDLEASVAASADGQQGGLRGRGSRSIACGVGDIAVRFRGRYRCAACRQERVPHTDRQ